MNRRRWLRGIGSALVVKSGLGAGTDASLFRQTAKSAPFQPPSQIQVESTRVGSELVRTSAAEFELLQSGQIRAYLLRGGKRVTLDDAETASAAETELVVAGKEIRGSDFAPVRVDVGQARGKLGARGRRIEMISQTRLAPPVERALTLEVYDDFPSAVLVGSSYRNLGTEELRCDRVVVARRRLNASLADAKATPYGLYSFHGSSGEWGKDDVVEMSRDFSRENAMGAATQRGQGGGVPVVAFWTARTGEAIGHIEPRPLECSFPVKTGADGLVQTSMQMNPGTILKP